MTCPILNLRLAGVLASVCLMSGAVAQTTYYVNGSCGSDAWTGTSVVCAIPNGPKRTIQAGIDASVTGDTVIVADGLYTGPGNRAIDFGGKDITVRSTGGPLRCTIDAQRQGSIFILASGEPATALIEGFTLTGATTSAIRCDGSSPTIRNCVIDNNWNGIFGGGLLCQNGADPTIEDCVLSNNLAGVGGGAYLDASNAVFRRCTFTGNRTDLFGAGGVGAVNSSMLTLVDCIVTGNTAMGFAGNGGGVQLNSGRAELVNCLIAGNLGTLFGGGITCVNNGDMTVINCTIANNTGDGGGGAIYVNGTVDVRNSILWGNVADQIRLAGGGITVGYSTVEGGWPGPGVLQRDPMFVDPVSGDYRLSAGSLVIDAGDNAAVPPAITTDLGGDPRFVDDPATPDRGLPDPARPGLPIVDMGAYEFQIESCYADCDGNATLDIFDFLCFQNSFVLAEPYACDCDPDPACDIFDFLCFQDAFVRGCP